MGALKDANKKIEETIVEGYKKIEDTVVVVIGGKENHIFIKNVQ